MCLRALRAMRVSNVARVCAPVGEENLTRGIRQILNSCKLLLESFFFHLRTRRSSGGVGGGVGDGGDGGACDSDRGLPWLPSVYYRYTTT